MYAYIFFYKLIMLTAYLIIEYENREEFIYIENEQYGD